MAAEAKAKYTKYYHEESDSYTYTVVLPDGQEFENVPMGLGDYLHKEEQKTRS